MRLSLITRHNEDPVDVNYDDDDDDDRVSTSSRKEKFTTFNLDQQQSSRRNFIVGTTSALLSANLLPSTANSYESASSPSLPAQSLELGNGLLERYIQ